ncbi:hypothetical protein OpiT1DRAFT_05380 [Opitutaceae bacterium TAV1]|nr:hypothetical protein OPIT5_29705 [Opitutaceae bacterium TAV5]EIQ00824.1 hypothetical protein OpiT1DRAFT_05380 [Opitutaceae bacterium TAV1]
MSFKSCALHPQPDGSIVLDDPQPLVFSGRHGLIARFVATEPQRASEPWKLCPGELHALAMPGVLVRDRAIFFEEVDGGRRQLQQLQGIHGVSAQRTEMLFSLMPLIVEHENAPLRIRIPDTGCTYNEELDLDGGVLQPEGPWRWAKPHLALGGVVLQRRRSPLDDRPGMMSCVG